MIEDIKDIERQAMQKVFRHLPIQMGILLFLNFLDRVNIGFAAPHMMKDLGLTASVFGFASGIFFAGYFLFEVPSNLMLQKIGARVWIGRIVLSWGVVSTATAFIVGPSSFIGMRLLLGIAESGFSAGMFIYMTYWFPRRYRGRIMAQFVIAMPIAFVIGGPVSDFILKLDGTLGISGWRWLFLLEGIPSIISGLLAMCFLCDSPRTASWLRPVEREWLLTTLEREDAVYRDPAHHSIFYAFKSGRVLLLCLILFAFTASAYAISFFAPQVVKTIAYKGLPPGLLSGAIFLPAVVGVILWGVWADREVTPYRSSVTALSLIVAGLIAVSYLKTSAWSLLALSVATIGQMSFYVSFWKLPPLVLTGTATAVGFAIITSVGNLGGFAGPYLFGLVVDSTGDFKAPLFTMAMCSVLSIVLLIVMRASSVKPQTHQRPFSC